jgi:nicotinamide mononucleotide (NMN) deamidase PncC
MDPEVRQLIKAIHGSSFKTVLALTGGGASAAGLLLSVPGGSRTVLEVRIPYEERALAEYLGHRPQKSCSVEVAREMAVRAHERAQWLAPGERVVGVGCTASLATDRPKRGEHRFHIAIRSSEKLASYSLALQKGTRGREAEESLLDRALLSSLAKAVGLDEQLSLSLLPGEEIKIESAMSADLVQAVVEGKQPFVCVEPDGRLRSDAPPPQLLVPGAYNPLHEGHRGLGLAAEQLTGHPAAFELCVINVDKPPLTAEEVRRRLQQFQWRSTVWVTRAPTFAEKAGLFEKTTFVVGADTAARMLSPRYYDDADAGLTRALEHIRARGCRFLVAGRACEDETFVEIGNLRIPHGSSDLFMGIPEDLFRRDISSTALRSTMMEGST